MNALQYACTALCIHCNMHSLHCACIQICCKYMHACLSLALCKFCACTHKRIYCSKLLYVNYTCIVHYAKAYILAHAFFRSPLSHHLIFKKELVVTKSKANHIANIFPVSKVAVIRAAASETETQIPNGTASSSINCAFEKQRQKRFLKNRPVTGGISKTRSVGLWL